MTAQQFWNALDHLDDDILEETDARRWAAFSTRGQQGQPQSRWEVSYPSHSGSPHSFPFGCSRLSRLRRAAVLCACLALLAAGWFLTHRQQDFLVLSDRSSGVTVRYTDQAPQTASAACLELYTEEELFSVFDTAIFQGTVTNIQNLELRFHGERTYRAVAEIQVEKVYRDPCTAGDTVTVLVPCALRKDGWEENTISGTVSAMEVGTRGIFMPMVYREDSLWEQNGATLALADVAGYGLADGERFLFLETEDGLIFDREAYTSIADAQSLKEVEAYVLRMLEE